MAQVERKEDFGARLRRAWSVVARTVEAMEESRSPVELLLARIIRLEREVAELKRESGAAMDDVARPFNGKALS